MLSNLKTYIIIILSVSTSLLFSLFRSKAKEAEALEETVHTMAKKQKAQALASKITEEVLEAEGAKVEKKIEETPIKSVDDFNSL